MNPVDKARKEARKKELKKNKKQRLQVRSAAIENKEPEKIIEELERLDPQGSLYKDKSKRLKETWAKLLAYYKKEDPERHDCLKKLEQEYEFRYQKRLKEIEAIKAAKEVSIEDVIMPFDGDAEIKDPLSEIDDDDPLLSGSTFVIYNHTMPGCPPGLPPDLGQIVNTLAQDLPIVPAKAPEMINLPQPNRLPKRPIKYNSTQSKSEPVKQQRVEPKKVIAAKPVLYKPSIARFVPASVKLKTMSNEKR